MGSILLIRTRTLNPGDPGYEEWRVAESRYVSAMDQNPLTGNALDEEDNNALDLVDVPTENVAEDPLVQKIRDALIARTLYGVHDEPEEYRVWQRVMETNRIDPTDPATFPQQGSPAYEEVWEATNRYLSS